MCTNQPVQGFYLKTDARGAPTADGEALVEYFYDRCGMQGERSAACVAATHRVR